MLRTPKHFSRQWMTFQDRTQLVRKKSSEKFKWAYCSWHWKKMAFLFQWWIAREELAPAQVHYNGHTNGGPKQMCTSAISLQLNHLHITKNSVIMCYIFKYSSMQESAGKCTAAHHALSTELNNSLIKLAQSSSTELRHGAGSPIPNGLFSCDFRRTISSRLRTEMFCAVKPRSKCKLNFVCRKPAPKK